MIREVHGFPTSTGERGEGEGEGGGEGKGEGKVFIGIMGCSPLGKGTDALFEGLEWRAGVRDLV